MNDQSYYVYVYVDPRNFEEFYYGKGKGSRKDSHQFDRKDSPKVARIAAIKKEGLQPIIRTVAAGLSECDAHLIETALIWKLGRTLTNKAAGQFVSLFRPQNSMHRELPRFDFQNDVYYFNVGEGEVRNWDDCYRHGFIAAGQGPRWRDQIRKFVPGDIVIAYLKRHGYVGVGRVMEGALPFEKVRIGRKWLSDLKLIAPNMSKNSGDPERSEYIARVNWIKRVTRDHAKWKPRSKLFTTMLVRASLAGQPVTLDFIEREFQIRLTDLNKHE